MCNPWMRTVRNKLIKRHECAISEYKRFEAKLLRGMAGRIGVDRGTKGIYVHKANKEVMDKLKKGNWTGSLYWIER